MIVFLGILSIVAAVWLWLLAGRTFRSSLKLALNADTPVTPSAPARWPAITVIIPARNEADTLPATIPTICRQDYPDFRVILVDDQSDDDSPRVIEQLQAAHPNLTVVHGITRPADWHGKQWAVKQGVDHTNTEYLLFTDADILFHPQVLKQSMRVMQTRNLEMFSLLPQLILGSPSERIALAGAMAVITGLFPLTRANDPKSRLALAAGGFILIRRDAYERVGGHAAVRNQMIEDLSLARIMKQAGVRMQTLFTCDLLHTRMYTGLADLWEGLSKNAFAGIDYSLWKYFVGTMLGLVIGVLPPLYWVLSVLLLTHHPSPMTWAAFALSLLINLCMVIVHSRAVRHLQLPWWHSFLLPVSGVLYSLIAAWSVYQHYFTDGTMWKGRRYRNDSASLRTAVPIMEPAGPVPSDPSVATDRCPGK
ncbi:MAG: glycosyltransferase [Bacillota bacterium]